MTPGNIEGSIFIPSRDREYDRIIASMSEVELALFRRLGGDLTYQQQRRASDDFVGNENVERVYQGRQ